jgi:hypothetical protein
MLEVYHRPAPGFIYAGNQPAPLGRVTPTPVAHFRRPNDVNAFYGPGQRVPRLSVPGVQTFTGSSAAKTAARFSTITPPALAFGKYTTTLRPDPVAEGNTTL